MAIRTLDSRTSLLSLFPQVGYTLSRLKAHPLGAPHIPAIEALRVAGVQILTRELSLLEAQVSAQALVDISDDRLDDFAGRVSKSILVATRDDRSHPMYRHFFGHKTLSELRRPMLGGQLETMRAWQPALEQSAVTALQGMAAELAALITEADAAVQARSTARQQSRYFRDVGERRQWVEHLNASRKELYGALAKLPHEQPGLPSDFAAQFFWSAPGREAGEEEPTIETLREQIAGMREALAEAEARLAAAEAAEAEAKATVEAKAASEAALAELDRAAAELEQRRAALRLQLSASPA